MYFNSSDHRDQIFLCDLISSLLRFVVHFTDFSAYFVTSVFPR